jgi:hypothetical protein
MQDVKRARDGAIGGGPSKVIDTDADVIMIMVNAAS